MDRRRLLALSAASLSSVTGFAGCLGLGADGSGDRTESTNIPTESSRTSTETATVDGPTLVLDSLTVRRHTTRAAQHIDVVADPDSQYVVVDLDIVSAGSNVSDESAVTVSDRDDLDAVEYAVVLDGDRYDDWFDNMHPAEISRHISIPVPTGIAPESGEFELSLGGGQSSRTTISKTHLGRIAQVPRFTLDEFTAEAGNATVQVTLTVTNEGDRGGRFLADLGPSTMSDRPEISFGVPPGETVTQQESIGIDAGGADEMTIICEWGDERHSRTVTL
ncbi:hypothetical protein [Haloarchaeobius sp. DFWS5]|uniref:hypothetical protein n=1 Tax=Haloarchaeobius sp. DFWS5 TaxID=3446114 RepID=UPI003EB7AA6D